MTQSRSSPELSAVGAIVLGGAALCLLVFGFFLWSATASISGAVIASGEISVDRNNQIVQHESGGTVADVLVREGDLVERGEPLLQLEGGRLRSELAIVERQYFEVLARKGRLEAERSGADRITFPADLIAAARANDGVASLMAGQSLLFDARSEMHGNERAALTQQQKQIESQIAGIAEQTSAVLAQRALLQQELDALTPLLDRGLVEVARVLTLKREATRLAGLSGELDASRAASEGRLTETEFRILNLGDTQREQAQAQLRDLEMTEVELDERRRRLSDELGRLMVVAPIAGIVHDLRVTRPGAVIRAAEALAHIVPQDRPLVVLARISPREIGEIHVGQKATLRVPSPDAGSADDLTGNVSVISADVIIDEVTGAKYYRAEIEFEAEARARLSLQPVRSGLPVEIFLRTGDRAPWTYLVKPLADQFRRAFRES